ncbi:hypothetical protein JOM56_004806 [Amanita muscaria]
MIGTDRTVAGGPVTGGIKHPPQHDADAYKMNNNLFVPQPTNTPRQTSPPPGQPPAQPGHSVTQHPQQSHFQALPAPAYNPQWTHPQPSWPPPSEQGTFNTNYSQWHGQQQQYQQYQQHQYHVPPPEAQSLPQLLAQPNYNPYQPTAGYHRHYVPQPVASLAYYLHPQQQQQQRLYPTLPQHHLMQMLARCRQFDSPDLPPSSQPQYLSLPSPAQNNGLCPAQRQGSGRGDGNDWSNNVQPNANRGGRGGNRGSYMGSGGGRAGQSDGDVRAHGPRGNFGGAASIQAEGHKPIPTSADSAVVPVATLLQGAQGNLTTVNNYGGTHGLENLKEYVSFAALHDSAEQDPDRRCHPGTRKTVLKQLRDWFDNPNPTDPIIWLHGPAGAGKSAIAQTIADEYKKRGVAATFFFYRSDASRNDGKRLFPTIAWQLAFSIPPTKDFIVHALNETPHLPTQAVEPQFEELPAPVVIIDGVDECSDEKLQQRFLAVIGNAVKNHRIPLRFLIVSRPEALIEETLNKFKDFTVSIDLAKLDDSKRDIQKYLEDKFFEIASNRGLDPAWPGLEIIEEIVSKSSGNFIFASLVIRFISDEDCSPESQLDIVRKLKPHGKISPFALLDELFWEILKRQRDQDFLETFLAVLVARSSIKPKDLHKDDATLMNVSEKDLHTKLRRMRSLLKFTPFIDVYHKSFLDFLQDPSRSGQYHVSKQGGLKRYLQLIVDSVVRHVSMAIEQPDRPKFKFIVRDYPPKIVLPVEDWQDASKPLLDLQDKVLNTSKPKPCRVTQVMRDLLLLPVFLQRLSDRTAATHVPESNMDETVTGRISAPVTEATQNILETDLDSCLSALLSCLQKMNSTMVVDGAIIHHMSSLLAFDYAETVARVRSVSDAQKLIDLIALPVWSRCSTQSCSPGIKNLCKGTDTSAVPPSAQTFSPFCQTGIHIRKICDKSHWLHGGFGSVNEQTISKWLERSSPNFIARTRVMLEIAKSIRYIHSMDIILYSSDFKIASVGCLLHLMSVQQPFIWQEYLFLGSDLRAKIMFEGVFAWWSMEALIYDYEDKDLLAECTYEASISAFANLFDKVCFDGHNENTPKRLVNSARQLIKRCRGKRRPTMEDIVKEMETWKLT